MFKIIPSLLGLALLALVSACSTRTAQTPSLPLPPATSGAPAPQPAPDPAAAYLFVHFTGESPQGEQIYFAVSEDGLNWTDLNSSDPVLLSDLGEKGVRDPAIVRSPDGKKYILLATDLRIAAGKGWDAARFQGSTSLVFWESTDLVNWSAPWMVDVASSIPEAGCAWAPEAIHDTTTGEYLVYWATISPRDGVREARIYASWTKDFRTFTTPELYIERVGDGLNDKDIIDTQIIEITGARHRYYRTSRDAHITLEGSDSLLGTWERIGDLSYLGYTARQVEGPILFPFNQERKWGLLVDQYAAGKGYLPLTTTDLDAPQGFRVLQPTEYSLGASRKRHGGVIGITRREYEALLARWPSSPVVRLASVASPGRFVRHANFRVRLDTDVRPAEDARWRIVPGLAGGADAVSLRAVNFPDHYLTATPSGLVMAPLTNDPAFATRATFLRLPGLADPAGVSFRTPGQTDQYLLERDSALVQGSVLTDIDRRRATFRIE